MGASGTRGKEDRFTYLTETPVKQLILKLAGPTILSMLVTSIYNSVDTYFVGRISTQATAAVGLVFSVMAIIQAFGFFCGHGSGNYVSRMLGAGERQEAEEAAATGFALSLLLGILTMALGLLFLDPLCVFIGSTPTTMADTKAYLSIILVGSPIVMGQCVMNNQLRFQGSAVYAMAGMVSGAILNIFLDPLFIFVFDMGVAGAAAATVVGQCAGFLVLYLGTRMGENIRLRFRNVRFNGHYLLTIVNGGAPSLFRQGFNAVAAVLLNTAAGKCGGDAAIAAMSVVSRVILLFVSAAIGFGQGYQPVCSFNYGAKKTDRVKEGFSFVIRAGVLFLSLCAVLCIVFAPSIMAFFRDDPEVIRIGTPALRLQALLLPLGGGGVMPATMMLQAIGKGVKASVCTSARNAIFFIPLVLTLPRFFGIPGLQATQPAADLLSAFLTIPLTIRELRKM